MPSYFMGLDNSVATAIDHEGTVDPRVGRVVNENTKGAPNLTGLTLEGLSLMSVTAEVQQTD